MGCGRSAAFPWPEAHDDAQAGAASLGTQTVVTSSTYCDQLFPRQACRKAFEALRAAARGSPAGSGRAKLRSSCWRWRTPGD
jgi:hypothetical protein